MGLTAAAAMSKTLATAVVISKVKALSLSLSYLAMDGLMPYVTSPVLSFVSSVG